MTLYEIKKQLSVGKTIYDLPLRVTYYARVSTEKDEQINSLNNQIDYFERLIQNVANWTYVKGYVDEGISGTSIKKRKQFMQMIEDAKEVFDLIITKEVSRFARDTLDSIIYTRKLLELGIGVYFMNDNINTLEADSELRLTIMASIAQDEIRKLSERTKFGFKRAVESGRVLGTDNIWGYRKNNGKLVIDTNQAPMIKAIFELYASDKKIGLRGLSAKLEKMGYLNTNNKPMQPNTLKRIIENPKYKGYFTGGLSTVVDYHNKVRHFNSKDDWTIYKDYERVPPIVSEELWERANKKLQERSKNSKGNPIYQNRYALSGKIYCEYHQCGYVRRVRKNKDKGAVVRWICQDYNKTGKKNCNSAMLLESDLYKKILSIFEDYNKYKEEICSELLVQYKVLMNKESNVDQISDIENDIKKLKDKKTKLLDLMLDNIITKNELKEKSDKITFEINNLTSKLGFIKKTNAERQNGMDYLGLLRFDILDDVDITEDNIEDYIEKFVSKILVLDTDKLELKITLNFNEIIKVTEEEYKMY